MMSSWQELTEKYYMSVVKRFPVTLVRGEGARVWDETGKGYLDFVAGWAGNALGHRHPVVVEALTQAVNTMNLVSNHYYTIPQVQLAQLLVENSCCDRIF